LKENLKLCEQFRQQEFLHRDLGDDEEYDKPCGRRHDFQRSKSHRASTTGYKRKLEASYLPDKSSMIGDDKNCLPWIERTDMEEEVSKEPNGILHFSPERVTKHVKDVNWQTTLNEIPGSKLYGQQDFENINDEKPKTLTIPWNGRILTPTLNQLKEFKGDLDLIEEALGSRAAKPGEKNFRIGFTWRNFILWPSPEQLKRSKGDLNLLSEICTHKLPISPSNQPFRSRRPRSPSQNSFTEF